MSLFRDARLWIGFLRRARRPTVWRPACWAQRLRWGYEPRIEPCADMVERVAEPVLASGSEAWIAASRIWHGYPDPPEWMFLALDARGETVAAADFTRWPRAWTLDETRVGCEARRDAEERTSP